MSYFYANLARKRVVFWKNLHSCKNFYTTAGRDGRDKFQVWIFPLSDNKKKYSHRDKDIQISLLTIAKVISKRRDIFFLKEDREWYFPSGFNAFKSWCHCVKWTGYVAVELHLSVQKWVRDNHDVTPTSTWLTRARVWCARARRRNPKENIRVSNISNLICPHRACTCTAKLLGRFEDLKLAVNCVRAGQLCTPEWVTGCQNCPYQWKLALPGQSHWGEWMKCVD